MSCFSVKESQCELTLSRLKFQIDQLIGDARGSNSHHFQFTSHDFPVYFSLEDGKTFSIINLRRVDEFQVDNFVVFVHRVNIFTLTHFHWHLRAANRANSQCAGEPCE